MHHGDHRTRVMLMALVLVLTGGCAALPSRSSARTPPASQSADQLRASRADVHRAGVAALRAAVAAGATFTDGFEDWYGCTDDGGGYYEFSVDGRLDVSGMPGDAGQRALAILHGLGPLGWSVSNPLSGNRHDFAQMLLAGPDNSVGQGTMTGEISVRGNDASLSMGGACLHSTLFGIGEFSQLNTGRVVTLE